MQQIEWRKFYGQEPIKPIAIEKYILDDGWMKGTRQMTYECCDTEFVENKDGMWPTFEIDDVVTHYDDTSKMYCINKYERGFGEIVVELLDGDMKRTGKTTYMDHIELMHVVKDAEWI